MTDTTQIQLGTYEHFKGNRYEVIGIARHSETLKEMVVYRALNGNRELWVRPIKKFSGNVLIDGKRLPRFKLIKTTQRKLLHEI